MMTKLTQDPIVCQREEDIPREVKKLRGYVKRYIALQKLWLALLVCLVCVWAGICTPVGQLFLSWWSPPLGKLLEVMPAAYFIIFILPATVCFLVARLFGHNWVEAYYKSVLVLAAIEPSPKRLGNFTYNTIHQIANDLANRMGFLVNPGMFLYNKNRPEANAFYTSIIDHHTKTEKIVLQRNLLWIVTEDELRAVIAHELGHVIQPWPFVFRTIRFSRVCELLADYNAFVYAGLLPTVNTLIKISARRDYLAALWEKAQEILLETGFRVESVEDLAADAKASIPQQTLGDRRSEAQAERLVRQMTKRIPPDSMTYWERLKRWMRLRRVWRLRQWRKKWKRHLPAEFTRFYADHHIDEVEFRRLVELLTRDPMSDLCVPLLPHEQRASSHPALRERLLFLARCAHITESEKQRG